MKKSKEFIIVRPYYSVWLKLPGNGHAIQSFCYRLFVNYFGIRLNVGEKKRIKITIEEI